MGLLRDHPFAHRQDIGGAPSRGPRGPPRGVAAGDPYHDEAQRAGNQVVIFVMFWSTALFTLVFIIVPGPIPKL